VIIGPFAVLGERKLEQQWVELYCTDVGAGVKKDSGPYTFVIREDYEKHNL
jgi:hypothetical protein